MDIEKKRESSSQNTKQNTSNLHYNVKKKNKEILSYNEIMLLALLSYTFFI